MLRAISVVLYSQGPKGPGNFPLRKEVIHPHVPVGIPCYDLTPITDPALDAPIPRGLGKRLQALPALMV